MIADGRESVVGLRGGRVFVERVHEKAVELLKVEFGGRRRPLEESGMLSKSRRRVIESLSIVAGRSKVVGGGGEGRIGSGSGSVDETGDAGELADSGVIVMCMRLD